jgi:hypothetical protein
MVTMPLGRKKADLEAARQKKCGGTLEDAAALAASSMWESRAES